MEQEGKTGLKLDESANAGTTMRSDLYMEQEGKTGLKLDESADAETTRKCNLYMEKDIKSGSSLISLTTTSCPRPSSTSLNYRPCSDARNEDNSYRCVLQR